MSAHLSYIDCASYLFFVSWSTEKKIRKSGSTGVKSPSMEKVIPTIYQITSSKEWDMSVGRRSERLYYYPKRKATVTAHTWWNIENHHYILSLSDSPRLFFLAKGNEITRGFVRRRDVIPWLTCTTCCLIGNECIRLCLEFLWRRKSKLDAV